MKNMKNDGYLYNSLMLIFYNVLYALQLLKDVQNDNCILDIQIMEDFLNHIHIKI